VGIKALSDVDSPQRIGNYVVERRLGSGGMGTVYLARSASGEPRAIKVLHAELSGSQELRSRLDREAAVLQRLRGDRSAAVYEVNTTADRPYLVMEYVPGLSLDKHIEQYGKLSGVLAWAVMDALLEATEMFHAEGVTHRDLKPSNVMLGEEGVKIIDFGISGLVGSSLTEIGSTPATTLWSSPEQMNGSEVGQASDIFNLGMIFAYAWTGRHPFEASKRDAAMLKLMTGEPKLDGVPSRLSPIITECLAKNPNQRPSAQEVRNRLRSISRSSSNSDTGSRRGDMVSPLTGTLLVNAEEQIRAETRERSHSRASMKYQPALIAATVVSVLLLFGLVVSMRGSGDDDRDAQAVSETSLDDSSPEPTSAVKTLDELRVFPRSLSSGGASVNELLLDLTNNSRFQREKRNQPYGLKWFSGKCKRNPRSVEPHLPIAMQFSSPNSQFVEEFEVALSHVRRLLADSGSPLAGSMDGTYRVVGNGEPMPAIFSALSSPGQAESRNLELSRQFGLASVSERPLRIVLSTARASEVDSLRLELDEGLRTVQSALPSGIAVDYGWAVPARRKLAYDPKEIDAAAVTVSYEYWAEVSTEKLLLVLARALLLGLGSNLDSGINSVVSVRGGEFVKSDYEFGAADLDVARMLGFAETATC